MKKESVSRVYAEALYDLASEQGRVDEVHEEIVFLEKILREDARLRVFFESPGIEDRERQAVIEASFRGRLADITANFLHVVVRKGRQVFLLDMLERFRQIHDEKAGIVNVLATAAVSMSEGSRDALRLRLEENLKKRVILECLADESLLGGLVVRYGGLVADGSLRKALRDIETSVRKIKLGSELIHENPS